MTMLQIRHIELTLHKAILTMDKPEAPLSGIVGTTFRSKYIQLSRVKDKSEWVNYESLIPWEWHRYILYEFLPEEAKLLLMLES